MRLVCLVSKKQLEGSRDWRLGRGPARARACARARALGCFLTGERVALVSGRTASRWEHASPQASVSSHYQVVTASGTGQSCGCGFSVRGPWPVSYPSHGRGETGLRVAAADAGFTPHSRKQMTASAAPPARWSPLPRSGTHRPRTSMRKSHSVGRAPRRGSRRSTRPRNGHQQ